MSLKSRGRKLIQLNEPFPGSEEFMVFAKATESEDWTHIYIISALSQDGAATVVKTMVPALPVQQTCPLKLP